MKDYLIQLVSSQTTQTDKFNVMREYLQALTLRILHEEGLFRSTAFVGGTALRFIYQLPRFSEDLDFSFHGEKPIDFSGLVKVIKRELTLAGYNLSLTYKDTTTVLNAFIKFEGLLFDVGLSPHPNQKFSIKIDIDTRPPKGGQTETVVVNKYFPLAFLTYERASLFSGKCHALLCRPYTKGRDYFDVGWYLSKWKDLAPHIPFLQNALKQTGWTGTMPTVKNWRDLLAGVVEKSDWKKVQQDVVNFLERPQDRDIFTKENVLALLLPG